ncbi:hypothetical protein PR003_g31937 [Phytophthora rubi]|uniref:Uncharacterized protein n=1 Tax=Phytophthora rubi TaxID=129364 RepID=A0A6A4B5S5_9STRA|nr:hypothetical protein PR003_g31937 [Phytophthora rubi]
MLAVLLSPMPAAAMLAMLLSLSPLLLRSPCRCGRAHRNAARRSPMPPPCSPFRHAAVAVLAVNARRAALAVPAAAMPAVLRSLCRPPPCCSRCAGRRHARRAALAVLVAAMLVMLLSLSPLQLRSPCRCGRAHRNATRRSPVPPPCSPSRHAAVAVLAVNVCCAALAVPAAAMPAVLRSLSPLPLRSP